MMIYDSTDYTGYNTGYNTMCVTNFKVSERPLYEKALNLYQQRYNRCDFYIRDKAYTWLGNEIDDYSALMKTNLVDTHPFWKIFDELKAEGEKMDNSK